MTGRKCTNKVILSYLDKVYIYMVLKKKKKVKENEETGKVEDKRRSDRHKKQSTADGE